MIGGWFDDTTPQALEVFVNLYRNMTADQRATRVFELCAFHESLQWASVRAMYPGASEHELLMRVASRRLDRETMIKVYGWDPQCHP
jgi:hypothetical protein